MTIILRPELSSEWIFPAQYQPDLTRKVSNFNRFRTGRLNDVKSSKSETGDFSRTLRRRKIRRRKRRTKRTIIRGDCCCLADFDDANEEPCACCEVLFFLLDLRTCATSMSAAAMTLWSVVLSDELIKLTTVSSQSLPVEI